MQRAALPLDARSTRPERLDGGEVPAGAINPLRRQCACCAGDYDVPATSWNIIWNIIIAVAHQEVRGAAGAAAEQAGRSGFD